MEAQNVAILEASTGAPARNLEDPLRREEEVRLCYVGGTRAWQRLYLVDGRSAAFGQRYELFN
jgi:superfamily I DNA/RNA helicase